MLSVKQQWEDKLYRNWLRGSLGLKYLREGIDYLVDCSVKDLHDHFIKTVLAATVSTTLQCGVCTLNNLLPDHAGGRCKQRTRGLCFCNKPSGRRKCPNGICSLFYDFIVNSHLAGDPSWKNTDPSKWVSDHWQVAKCFTGPAGFAGIGSAKETDAAGLLSIAINCNYVTGKFSCGLNVLKQMRQTRNKLLHSSCLTLQDTEVSDYIDQMIQLLLDPRKLVHDIGAQNAVRQLQKLKNIACCISSKNEKEIRKQALQAIKESEENALENIKEAEIKAIDNIENTKPDLGLMKNGNEQKTDMIENLIRTYKRFYTSTDFSPILPGREVGVDEIYAPLDMRAVSGEYNHYYYHYCNTRDFSKEVSKHIKLEDMALSMTNVFILAKAGMGKTTFCKHLISEWCKLQSNEPSKYSVQCLNEISLLFYVSLKHVNAETTVEQMIKQQLFDAQFHDLVDHVLAKEPQKCLVILDGLDEWTPPENIQRSPRVTTGLPIKELMSGYATMYTTRTWKFETIKPRDCEVDIEVEITGIHPESSTSFIESVFKQLNKISKSKATSKTFIDDLRARELNRLQYIPRILLLLACMWHDKQAFDSSLSAIYSSIIEWLLLYAERRQGKYLNDSPSRDKTDCGNVPVCFTDKLRCRKHFTSLVVPLARFSFLTLLNLNFCRSRYVFQTTDFYQYGLDKDCINTLLDIGLLTEKAVLGKAAAGCYRSLAFIHETFSDFFTALYIAQAGPKERFSMFTAEKHLEMSLVYQFLSGMNGSAMAGLSKEIGTSVDTDENNKDYRRGTSTYTGFVAQMQHLILSCLKEATNSDVPHPPMVLRDIYISEETRHLLSYLTKINMSKVVSIYCDTIVTCEVYSRLEKICDLELFVCKGSVQALCPVLEKCARVIKSIVLTESDLTVSEKLHQLNFAQLTKLTLFKVKATRTQVRWIYMCSPCLVSVNLDSCMFLKQSVCDADETMSYFIASVKQLNIARCYGLPSNENRQPMLQELVCAETVCFDCAELIKKSPRLRLITLIGIDLGTSFLPHLFPSSLVNVENVHMKNIKISCSNFYFHLEALLKIPTLSAVKLDRVHLINENAETIQEWIKQLEIKAQNGEIRRYVTESYETRVTNRVSLLSTHLTTKSD